MAKCHLVPHYVSVSIYCDVLRFDDEDNVCYYIFRKYGGYLMKLVDLHSAALPPQLRQAHINAVSDEDIAYTGTFGGIKPNSSYPRTHRFEINKEKL